jgi:TFIIF-interacting CTD phosphatase-like protein
MSKISFVSKRSRRENILYRAAQLFDIVVFTESRMLLNILKNSGCIAHQLYRDCCIEIKGKLKNICLGWGGT